MLLLHITLPCTQRMAVDSVPKHCPFNYAPSNKLFIYLRRNTSLPVTNFPMVLPTHLSVRSTKFNTSTIISSEQTLSLHFVSDLYQHSCVSTIATYRFINIGINCVTHRTNGGRWFLLSAQRTTGQKNITFETEHT
jgi:hypothetical protein